MKKIYQSGGWVLAAVLALDLSGCSTGSSYLSRITGRKDDQKLVDVDGKATTKTKDLKTKDLKKKSDPVKDKATDSQLAKKSAVTPKPKSKIDSSPVVASKDAKPAKPTNKKPTARDSMDPFESPELKDLGARTKKAEPAATDLASKTGDREAKPTTKAALAETDSSSRVQEVDYKVEDKSADVPEWAADDDSPPAQKGIAKASAKASAKSKAAEVAETGDTSRQDFEVSKDDVPRKKLKEPEAAKDEASPASGDLASLCPGAQGELRVLIGRLNESDIEGLKRGIHRIGRMGPEARPAAPALIHLLNHKDGFVRTHAALALTKMQASPPEAVQTVVDSLKAKDPGLRSFAAAVLAEMGPQAADALATLSESLNDRDGYVRLHAAEVLIRHERWAYDALETLLRGLKDKDENIRWLATYSLAELAPESQETVDALVKATRDPVPKVKLGAIYALGEIGPFAKSALGELQKLSDSTADQELVSAVLYARQQIAAGPTDQ